MPKKKSAAPTPVEALTHKAASRKNIPTEELRDFYDEPQPQTLLYPRDPSLDPQLVWKGKDEQDRQPLAVPVVPVYIQEKIHPQALIDDFRARHAKAPAEQQLDLFADFNGIDSFDKKIEFYQHDAHWTNRMILGDSLAIMTSLAEKEGLKGQVQTIYLDPPYGIKFGSNWQVSTRKRDVKDGKAEDASRQPEQVKAFRDTWQLGIHSYLTYLRDRLTVARDLLTESGSVFVQIGDENVHLVRAVMDEVFGSNNWIALIAVQKTTTATNVHLPLVSDYLLWFAKNKDDVKYRAVYSPKVVGRAGAMSYIGIELADGSRRTLSKAERDNPATIPNDAKLFSPDNFTSASMGREKGEGAACWFAVEHEGKAYRPYERSRWKTNEDGMRRILAANRAIGMDKALRYVRFFEDFAAFPLHNLWTDVGGAADKAYVVETTPKVVERCLLMTTDPGDLVLDPTCGSGTTAYVAEQWGRRWITCDTSRVALALARTRLMAAKFPFYLLADSPEGIAKEAELSGQKPPTYETHGDVRKGFVYKRVPHVTLKSIANNEEIDVIHAKWQPQVDAARAAVNKALKAKFEEWEVPREADSGKPNAESQKLLDAYWEVRRKRQQEIDACIARHADQELLYDQPYEDNARLRVTGPFTVESLSPHRRLTVQQKLDQKKPDPRDGRGTRVVGPDQFGNMIIENQRLKFDTLEPFAGEWIHATGTFTDAEGTEKRVAVCIGPEHGTVGPDLVKEAAKEAVRGVGYDLLYILGFAFDPHVDEETKRYGKLGVHICRMNPDLSMGDELLKKTGAGNLFMVFGEPDIVIRTTSGTVLHGPTPRRAGGRKPPESSEAELVVEINGVDVYDPTTGEIRSESTDDIACWFLDTSYDGESFFVRHAYFTGNQEPYEKLKRALRAEIDEAAWSTLYQTTSQPFPKPATGKIAVKVINHYGDEVLKVYPVG
jgi:adenine-specific DNA-methyltransferase